MRYLFHVLLILVLASGLPFVFQQQASAHMLVNNSAGSGDGAHFEGGPQTSNVFTIEVCVGYKDASAETIVAGDLVDPNGNHFPSTHPPITVQPGYCHEYFVGGPSSDYAGVEKLDVVGTYLLHFAWEINGVVIHDAVFDIHVTAGDPNLESLTATPDVVSPGDNVQIKLCANENGPISVNRIMIRDAESDYQYFEASNNDKIMVPAGQCHIWNTNTDFSGLSTENPGTYLVYIDTLDVVNDSGFDPIYANFRVGFFVLPEGPIGVAALIGSSLVVLGGFVYFKRGP
jgi:hypothetical protein